MYILLADSPQDLPRIEAAVDGMFHNSPFADKNGD